ncbi:Jacalin-like lectin [Gracilaria domingensis]|nr:Jacalin-like lectin [Gracilaria domingensis]
MVQRSSEYDGIDGTAFDDSEALLGWGRIREIKIYYDTYVRGIGVVIENGRYRFHGSVHGTYENIRMANSARITKIEGRKGVVIDQLTIYWMGNWSDEEYKLGPYAGNGGIRFMKDLSPNNDTDGMIYLYGRDRGDYLSAIGFGYGGNYGKRV